MLLNSSSSTYNVDGFARSVSFSETMEAPVSVSLGVIRSLPAKLERLLSPEDDHRLHKREKNKIRLLKDHLQELIDKYLMEPSEVEAPTSSAARCWVKEVRELSYDIDDFLDELVYGLNATAASHKNLRGKIAKVREDRSRSRWVADETTQFKSRLEEAIQRHKSSMEKLEEWLSDGEQGLRVVSIVGSGGIGKTTLAKELYSKLRRQFECRAFARSSQKPDIRRLLTSILLQVRRHQLPNDLEMGNLTETIRAYLQNKKSLLCRHQPESLHKGITVEHPNSRLIDLETKLQELFFRSRSQDSEIWLLCRKIMGALHQELLLLDEKHNLERKLTDLRMVANERQEEAISGALKQLSQRKSHLEENMRLTTEQNVANKRQEEAISNALKQLGQEKTHLEENMRLTTEQNAAHEREGEAISNALKQLGQEKTHLHENMRLENKLRVCMMWCAPLLNLWQEKSRLWCRTCKLPVVVMIVLFVACP
nr:putative disease resistance RPP13-like protein 3 isoform X6 [Setaria viridis]